MNGLPRSKEGGISPSELANMLRKSADIVDRKEFHPLLYQTMRALTSYAGEYADGGISTAATTTNGSSVPTKQQQQQQLKRQGSDKLQQQQQQAGPTTGNNNNNNNNDPPGKKTTSVFADVPDSILDGGPNNAKSAGLRSSTTTTSSSATNGGGGAAAAAERVGAPGGQFASASAAAGGNKSDQSKGASSSSHMGVFSLKGIKKGIEKLGTDVHKFVGELEHQVCQDNNSGIANNKDDVPFDEYAWCDEHFTRGCACKTRNAHQKSESSASIDSLGPQQQQQQQQQQQGPSLSDAGASSTTESPDDKPSKPCFQRPINPSSNLISNGWIEQQRRSKMRVVWKDVLASLVEGRRPGEETTLWIQRQVINAQTGKVTGLEALHQIPMKWLEDVNYVDLYGDHRFTLKVYNIAEEFYFRTRDESSAQSWVVTLRSARDASLESTHRMEGGVSGADADEEIINNTMKPSAKEMGLYDVEDWDLNKQSDQEGGRPQAGSDSGGDSRPSSAPQPQHQSHSQQQQQPRLKISELRAIAHGAGYDTRGMERQDLERIAAHVRGGAAAALPTSPDDNIKQSMQREKEMREAEQRAAAERREREMQEEARVEKMRRDREETERRRMEEAAEQQRRRQQEFEAQAAEIKRKQEEERQRKMAELRAQQQAQQQQYQQAQAEEQRRRAQAQHQAQIPSPPVSGGQTNFQSQPPQWGQPQQAYHQQQQAWQQQQQHHQQQQQQQHFQHQGLNRTTTQNHAQQAWQQQHQQHAQNQAWQQQQQQRPPQPPPNNTQGPSTSAFQSKYAKQMEDKDDEDQPAATLQIKRSILINWALQPPNLNVLRPIDQLITTIHKAMPPAYGVAAHAYFAKFTPIAHSELVNGPHPDETKMKKAVRKVRVFLHPDKLPRDLSSDQAFMARMLWDITSDSWEEFQKHKDELDWIRS